jgi:hypothetical protein
MWIRFCDPARASARRKFVGVRHTALYAHNTSAISARNQRDGDLMVSEMAYETYAELVLGMSPADPLR